SLGEKQKALEYLERALPLYQEVGDRKGEAATLNNIGAVYNFLGEKQQALEYYDRALPLRQAVGDRGGEGTTLNNIGGVYSDLGEKQKALEYYERALPLRQAVGDRGGEAQTLNNIGAVYSSLGEKQKALEYYDRALPLSQAVGDRGGEANTLWNIASTQSSQGNLETALTQMEKSIAILEDLRTKAPTTELRQTYFASVQGYYQFYLDLLMELHRQNPNKGYDARAFQASESSRARTLTEILTEAQFDLKADLPSALLAEEKRLNQALSTAEQQRVQLLQNPKGYANADLEAIKSKIETILDDLQTLEAQIRRENPAYANLKYPQPLTLSEIQANILDDDILLLEYALGEQRSYLFAVSKTEFTAYELPARQEIEAATELYITALQAENRNPLSEGTELAKMLLSPVADKLKNQRLAIVADGKLNRLPFAALPWVSEKRQTTALNSIVSDPSGNQGKFNNYSRNNNHSLSSDPSGNRIPRLIQKVLSRGLNHQNLSEFTSSQSISMDFLYETGIFNPWRIDDKQDNFLTNSSYQRSVEAQSTGASIEGASIEGASIEGASIEGASIEGASVAPLLANHEIINLSSASSLEAQRSQWAKRTLAPKQIAVLADPVFSTRDPRLSGETPPPTENSLISLFSSRSGCSDFERLPNTKAEAENILALVPDDQEFLALGFSANRSQALNSNLSQYQILHLATHGCINDDPLRSGLVFSLYDEKSKAQDGLLRLQDIYNLDLNAELVVLSACQTGIGEAVSGEGVVGLTRGFMYAGAKRVVVSLWNVNDAATANLMTDYYEKMLKEDLDAIAALREAQLQMWKNGEFPYKWAAFTIQGDWR
ncbi:CHAT domain-containing tetratricopeptide repeat protein, partial [Spirulina sp. 06S082]|uniref:CHAT domain-containing protein n=1 Tax=Spirulina sp. 06S082 TaxID=3110248 RepID=UPI002B20D144